MYKNISALIASILILVSCEHSDQLVAEVHHQKLYLSEVLSTMPVHLSSKDSVQYVTNYIDQWALKELLLYNANKDLSISEKDFNKEIEEYKTKLILEQYYKKMLEANTQGLQVSDNEIRQYITDNSLNEEKVETLIKLNYIKLGKKSSITKKVKPLFFKNVRTYTEEKKLMALLSDSIEYYIDAKDWLYLENVRNEIPFQEDLQLKNGEQFTTFNFSDDQNEYLVVLLDQKEQRVTVEEERNFEAIKQMLMQEKKARKIEALKEELFNQAVEENTIIRLF